MATRTRTFWEFWDCTSCDNKRIRGDQKRCPTCGNPRENPELADGYLGRGVDPVSGKVLATDGEAITDATELAEALSGADWYCSQCETGNRNLDAACVSCGNPRYEAVAPEQVLPTTEAKQESHRETAWLSDVKQKAEAFSEHFNPNKAIDWNLYGMIAGSGTVLVLLIWAVFWCFQTHEVTGTVKDMSWTHTVYTDTFTKVADSDWQDSITRQPPVMPVNGRGEQAGAENVRNCSQQHHHDRKYVCGTKRECSDRTRQVKSGSHEVCSTHRNGNGSATETCHDVTDYRTEHYEDCHNVDKYCTEPIYKSHCDFDTYKWKLTGTVNGGSHGTENLVWLDPVSQGPLDRIRREEGYTVVFSYMDGSDPVETTTVNPHTQTEYLTWNTGMESTVIVTNMGTVSDVKHTSSSTQK